MKIILSHPTGNANVRAAAKGFASAGLLQGFQTTLACFPGTTLDHLGGIRMFSEIRRRSYDAALQPYTKMHPWKELGRTVSLKLHLNKLLRHEKGVFCTDAVYQDLDRHVARQLRVAAKKGVNNVYAYEDGAYDTFKKAHRLKIKCFYDLPTGYWKAKKKLLELEGNRLPEWKGTFSGLMDSEKKLLRKDKEIALANKIIVASTFVASTLQFYEGTLPEIKIIPYGFPPVNEKKIDTDTRSRPVKLLFVGKLSQQKGIADLLSVVTLLKNEVTLTIVGRKMNDDCAPLNEGLKKHVWFPSLSHSAILALMQEHDILIFPSLFDGFGLVITEAMSQGTPVITTERSAGTDLIDHEKNGWIIKAGDPDSLQAQLEKILHNRDVIPEMGRAALVKASQRPWSIYEKELANFIIDSN